LFGNSVCEKPAPVNDPRHFPSAQEVTNRPSPLYLAPLENGVWLVVGKAAAGIRGPLVFAATSAIAETLGTQAPIQGKGGKQIR
jgi:hypothetical protein